MIYRLAKELLPFSHRGATYAVCPQSQTLYTLDEGALRIVLALIGEGIIATDRKYPLIEFFCEEGILVPGTAEGATASLNNECETRTAFRPCEITLILTNRCQLRCLYCYARADSKGEDLPWVTAKAGMELVIRNARELNRTRVDLTFLGGGEPTLNWRLFRQSVIFFKRKCKAESVEPFIAVVTNGILGNAQLAFLSEHANDILVSFDGTDMLQNSQRPFASGRGSWSYVENTLQHFASRKKAYSLRTTVTSANCAHVADIVRFVGERFRPQTMIFEPVGWAGRASPEDPIYRVNTKVFAESFLQGKEWARQYGIALQLPGADTTRPRSRFCGACTGGFVLAPGGVVTTCNEVTNRSDKRAHAFIYGQYAGSSIEIDGNRRTELQERTPYSLDRCRCCFAKMYCAGHCPAKAMLYSPDNPLIAPDPRTCAYIRYVVAEALVVDLVSRSQNTGTGVDMEARNGGTSTAKRFKEMGHQTNANHSLNGTARKLAAR